MHLHFIAPVASNNLGERGVSKRPLQLAGVPWRTACHSRRSEKPRPTPAEDRRDNHLPVPAVRADGSGCE